MSVKLLAEHQLEFLSLKRGCTGPSESTLVKMPHCWKSHDMAQILSTRQFYIKTVDVVRTFHPMRPQQRTVSITVFATMVTTTMSSWQPQTLLS